MRQLSDAEIASVAGGDAGDVVVTAYRTNDGGAVVYQSGGSGNPYGGGSGGGGGGGGSGSPPPPPAGHHAVNVTVHVSNSANQADAQTAAQNVAIALATIEDALGSVDQNTQVSFDNGSSISAGDLLTQIENTTYIVSDSNPSGSNGGVGSADRTHMTDTLVYTAFEGQGSYADPNYQNDAGMIGIMLHEAGHMTAQGATNLQQENTAYRKLVGAHKGEYGPYTDAKFYGSDFGLDNEIFADDFAVNAGHAIGLGSQVDQFDQQRRSTYPGEDYEGAQVRYNDDS